MAKIHNPHDEFDIKLVNQTVLDGEISTLENAISTETSRAEREETKLAEDLANEITRAIAAETKLTNDLAAETTRAGNAEAELDKRLTTEISGREAAITEIKTVIGDIDENATVANLINDNTSAITNEINRASAREDSLDTLINDEITRSTAKDTALEDTINQEITRATAAEEVINIKIGTINERFEQKFENNSTSPVNCRGFGDLINNSGFLKSVTVYCPESGNTSQSVYLKVFEKTTAPHIFKGISDAPLTHGLNNTLKYTFENSSIVLEKNKEYFFVFSTEAQKESTQFSDGNSDSVDCCIKRASKSNAISGGLLGSSGYSRSDLQAIYVIEQEPSLSKLTEDIKVSINNNSDSISTLNVEVEKIKNSLASTYSNLEEAAQHNKDNCNAKGIQFIAPENGYLTDLYIACRDNNGSINTNPQYAKLWDITDGYGANAVLKAVSLNTQIHNINANEDYDLKYIFKNVELIKGNKYAVSTVLEANKDDASISMGLINGCYRTFSLKNSGILKAAFINDDATGENSISHSPILSLTIIGEIAKKIDEKLDKADALTMVVVNEAIGTATADFVSSSALSSTLENYQLKAETPKICKYTPSVSALNLSSTIIREETTINPTDTKENIISAGSAATGECDASAIGNEDRPSGISVSFSNDFYAEYDFNENLFSNSGSGINTYDFTIYHTNGYTLHCIITARWNENNEGSFYSLPDTVHIELSSDSYTDVFNGVNASIYIKDVNPLPQYSGHLTLSGGASPQKEIINIYDISESYIKYDITLDNITETFITDNKQSGTIYTYNSRTNQLESKGTITGVYSKGPLEVAEDIILTPSDNFQIITATAVSSINEVTSSVENNTIRISTNFSAITNNTTAHIIVDSICDSAAYDNAQHVCHVIPVTITV